MSEHAQFIKSPSIPRFQWLRGGYSAFRIPQSQSPLLYRSPDPIHDLCHPFIIKGLRYVRRPVIIQVPVEGRVRDHTCRIPELSEGPMVGKIDADDDRRRAHRDDGQVRALLKIARDTGRKFSELHRPHDRDEIAGNRIPQFEERDRVVLRTISVTEISDHLQTDHPLYLLPFFMKALSVVITAHFAGAIRRQLLQSKGDEPDRSIQPFPCKHPREGQHSGDAARVIIGARRGLHAVVVGADHQYFFRRRLPNELGYDVIVGFSSKKKWLPCYTIPE